VKIALRNWQTTGQLIEHYAGSIPAAPAIVSAEGATLTWAQLGTQLERTRAALHSNGIGPTDRIAIVLPNGPALASAFLTISACAASAPLNPTYSENEFTFFLSDLRAKAVVVEGNGPAAEIASWLGLPILNLEADNSAPGFFNLRGPCNAPERAQPPATPDNIALLLHTSGTTARPKLVPLSHVNLLTSARNMVAWLQLGQEDRCLNVMPLFHIHGLVGGLLAPIAAGGSSICPPVFEPDKFFTWLGATRPTWYTAVPTMHRAIVARADQHRVTIEACPIRFVRSSSASLHPKLLADLGSTFQARVVEAYSMTEGAHQVTSNPLVPSLDKEGTVGLAAGPEVAILDDTGRFLPHGEVGEVAIRGPSVMKGYDGNPEANAVSFVGEWFRTGDQGRVDAEGYLTLTGRLKEQINRGGEKISPVEIDRVLLDHSDILDAVSFSFPHPTLGEEIAAAVVPRRGLKVTGSEVRTFLRQHLAPFKVPRRILIVGELPKGPTGKLQRRLLAEIFGLTASNRATTSSQSEIAVSCLEIELAKIWSKVLKVQSVGFEDDFLEKGGDSLAASQMLLEVEELVGRTVPETVLFDSPTIRQMARSIAMLGRTENTPLTAVQTNGDHAPLFFFHGDYVSGGYYTRRLARLIGPAQPFVAVAPHGWLNEPVPTSLEEMAAERLPLLLAAQPRGAFRLGGMCCGALVAYEAARLLVQAGREVQLVAMIDPPTFNARPMVRLIGAGAARLLGAMGGDLEQRYPRLGSAIDAVWRLASQVERLARRSPAERRAVGRAILQQPFTRLIRPPPSPSFGFDRAVSTSASSVRQKVMGDDSEIGRKYSRLLRRYIPEPLAVPLLFFSVEYDGRPFRRLSPEFEIVRIPGRHFDCVTTHLDLLADHLARRLRTLPVSPIDPNSRQSADQPNWGHTSFQL